MQVARCKMQAKKEKTSFGLQVTGYGLRNKIQGKLQGASKKQNTKCEIKKVDLFLRYFLSPLLKAFVALYEGGL